MKGSDFRTNSGQLLTPQDIVLTARPNVPNLAPAVATLQLVDEGLEPSADGSEGPPANADDDLNESCAQSASMSWDMPVELILCLGSDPTQDGLSLGNPPGSSSFTVEALSAQLSHRRISHNYSLEFGAYRFSILAANIDSRTHNLAVGDLYGTYNYVLNSTGDSFYIGNI